MALWILNQQFDGLSFRWALNELSPDAEAEAGVALENGREVRESVLDDYLESLELGAIIKIDENEGVILLSPNRPSPSSYSTSRTDQ